MLNGSIVVWQVLSWLIGGALLICALIEAFELIELFLPRRNRTPRSSAANPFVSFHVPICSEPPDVVAATLKRLKAIAYTKFEVIVVDNNTQDERLWRPIEDMCATLGGAFRFFHLPTCPGYKAEALNFALSQTSPNAELVAVIDADYEVEPNFLSDNVGYFANSQIAFVQTPQDYRDWEGNVFSRILYWEYWQVFAVTMLLRDYRNAILLHGTMSLIRKKALELQSGWAEWCLTEDSEFGLRLLSQGSHGLYVPKTYGRGLMAFTYRDYKRQRWRWVFGGGQQARHYARQFFLEEKKQPGMSPSQKLHYLRWWIHWLRDSIIVISLPCVLLAAAGVLLGALPAEAFEPFSIGLVAVIFQLIMRHLLIYKGHLSVSLSEAAGALLATVSLVWTIGTGWIAGTIKARHVFHRTPKKLHRDRNWLLVSGPEMFCGIVTAVLGAAIFERWGRVAWPAVLSLSLLSSLFFPAVVMARLSNRALQPNRSGEIDDEIGAKRASKEQKALKKLVGPGGLEPPTRPL